MTWREVDGEIVALDLSSSTYLTVNPAGAFLWSSLVDGASVEELTRRLVATYEVELADAAKDVEIFLAPLRERGLINE